MTEESFIFDPRALISPPYEQCPFCRTEEAYGVLMIIGGGYVRRCRECMRAEKFSLPPAPKKLLYLDQFAISKLMIAIHPEHRDRLEQKEGAEQAAFWLNLFERLDRLVKLQLLACPESLSHWEESVPARSYEDLRRMYEHLSAAISFNHPAEIKRFQLHASFVGWLDGTRKVVTVKEVTSGRLDAWTDRLQVRARLEPPQDELAALQELRERTHTGLAAEVERWRRESRRGFHYYFEEQLAAAGPVELRAYSKWVQAVAAMTTGAAPLNLKQMIPTNSAHTMTMLRRMVDERGVPRDEQLSKISEFFGSAEAKQMPWLKIACGMLAALAVKASLQQAPNPDAGMITDLNTVATLLPYCDAIFIDNRCAELLQEATEQVPLAYEANVFSTGTRDELLRWLDEVEASALPQHLTLVNEVYGPGWPKPFTTMFEAGEGEPG